MVPSSNINPDTKGLQDKLFLVGNLNFGKPPKKAEWARLSWRNSEYYILFGLCKVTYTIVRFQFAIELISVNSYYVPKYSLIMM